MKKTICAIGVVALSALALPADISAQAISEEFVLQACDGADDAACSAFAAAYIAQATSVSGTPVQKQRAVKALIGELVLAADEDPHDAARADRVANALNASIAGYLDQIGADTGNPDLQRRQIAGLVVDLVDLARARSDSATIGNLISGAIGTIADHRVASAHINGEAVKAIAETLDPGHDETAARYTFEELDTALTISEPVSAN